MTGREAVYQALFARLSSIAGFVTVSRKLKHWADVDASSQPALYQAQVRETPENVVNGLAQKWTLDVDLYVYVHTSGDESPSIQLNQLVDAIEQRLQPDNALQRTQTLGGLVQWVRISGTIETSEGTLGDQAVAIIPIQMFTT